MIEAVAAISVMGNREHQTGRSWGLTLRRCHTLCVCVCVCVCVRERERERERNFHLKSEIEFLKVTQLYPTL